MTSEKKQEYTLRITQANGTTLVVILYELFFDYIEETKEAKAAGDRQEFLRSLDKAQDCLSQLIGSLHMENELATSIYRVYLFVAAQLGYVRGSQKIEKLEDAKRLMKRLYEIYKEDVKSDTSGPVMDNSQSVYAGLTYGKSDLNVSLQQESFNRGFLV